MTTQQIAMRDAFGNTLVELADSVPEMVVLDADVSASTKTGMFAERYPDRFFNVGVAEANMAGIAAGLATCGLRPVVNTFAIFLALKCADQIRNDMCYNNLPVLLGATYGGLSDSFDGATHQSITDLAVMRAMPNMTVVVPSQAQDVEQAVRQALRRPGPTFLRLSRNAAPTSFETDVDFEIGKIRKLREGSDITIAGCGIPFSYALAAAEQLSQQGVSVDLLEVSTIKPLDVEALAESASKTGRVLTVEEHNIYGGLGGAVAEALAVHSPAKMDFVGVEDCFTESGPYDDLMTKYGLSTAAIVEKAKKLVG
jgi:transketolase